VHIILVEAVSGGFSKSSKDENVFDIQQGVSIAIFIKNNGEKKRIKYYDIRGDQDFKYDFLSNNSLKSITPSPLTNKQALVHLSPCLPPDV
jgi:hypothetical protein